MPHRCVRCGTVYPNNSAELMKGCNCGSRVFLFIREEDAAKQSDEHDYKWLEDEFSFLSKDKPVSIDADAVENLRVIEQGHYEFDLPSLMNGNPLVIKSDRDVYYVKLPEPKKPKA